jgi:hypothetical protein
MLAKDANTRLESGCEGLSHRLMYGKPLPG